MTSVTEETPSVYVFTIHSAALTNDDAKNGLTIEGFVLERVCNYAYCTDDYEVISRALDLPLGTPASDYYPSDDELPALPDGYEWGDWRGTSLDITYIGNNRIYFRDRVKKTTITFPVYMVDENGVLEATFEGEVEVGISVSELDLYIKRLLNIDENGGYTDIEIDGDNSQYTYEVVNGVTRVTGVTKITYRPMT